MRNIPVDSTQVRMLAMSCGPVPVWGENGDGRRVILDGQQERDEITGEPLWAVECVVPSSDPRDRAEVVAVKVPSRTEPKVEPLSEITFYGLQLRIWVSRDGKLGQAWAAQGVAEAHVAPVQKAS